MTIQRRVDNYSDLTLSHQGEVKVKYNAHIGESKIFLTSTVISYQVKGERCPSGGGIFRFVVGGNSASVHPNVSSTRHPYTST